MGMMKKLLALITNGSEPPKEKQYKPLKAHSQTNKILARLKAGKHVTAIWAASFTNDDGLCTTKLTSRISDLRKKGYKIGDYWAQRNGKRFKVYYMEQKK